MNVLSHIKNKRVLLIKAVIIGLAILFIALCRGFYGFSSGICRPFVFYLTWLAGWKFSITALIIGLVTFLVIISGVIYAYKKRSYFLPTALLACIICFYITSMEVIYKGYGDKDYPILQYEDIDQQKFAGEVVAGNASFSDEDFFPMPGHTRLYDKWGKLIAWGNIIFEKQKTGVYSYKGETLIVDYISAFYDDDGLDVQAFSSWGRSHYLEKLAIKDCDSIGKIIQFVSSNFGELKAIYVDSHRENPSYIVSPESFREFQNSINNYIERIGLISRNAPTKGVSGQENTQGELAQKPQKVNSENEYVMIGKIQAVNVYTLFEKTKVEKRDYVLLTRTISGTDYFYCRFYSANEENGYGEYYLVSHATREIEGISYNAVFDDSRDKWYFNNPQWGGNGNNQWGNNQNNNAGSYDQPRSPQPMQVWISCGACNNSGQCQLCGGLGWRYSPSSRSYDGKEQCTSCGGDGNCHFCAGNGGHNEIQYR